MPALTQWNAMLFGASAWSGGPPAFIAASPSTTTGSGSYVTSTSSLASSATYGSSATTTATASPAYRTTSFANAEYGGVFRLEFGISQAVKMLPISPLRSAAVKTPKTPGSAAARAVSMCIMRACAYVLRTNFANTVPSGSMFATYAPRPVRNRSSSVRGTDSPINCAMPSPPSGPRRRRGDGLHDVHVACAAAQVSGDRHANLLLRGLRVHPKQFACCEDDAGCAKPALKAMVFPERLLQGVQPSMGRKPFDCRDLGAVRLDRKHRARLDGVAVKEHRAGPAMGRVAALVCPDKPQMVADEVYKQQTGLHLPFVRPAIHRDRDPMPTDLLRPRRRPSALLLPARLHRHRLTSAPARRPSRALDSCRPRPWHVCAPRLPEGRVWAARLPRPASRPPPRWPGSACAPSDAPLRGGPVTAWAPPRRGRFLPLRLRQT